MIKKEDVELMPTKLRESIIGYLKTHIKRSEQGLKDTSVAYTMTLDEKQRATALQIKGELNVLYALLKVFEYKQELKNE